MLNYRYLGILSFFIILTLTLGAVSAHDDFNITDAEIADSNQDIGDGLKMESEKVELKDTGNGKTFDDIQNTIDEADEGSEIELNGTFTSTGKEIKISKSITLNGNHNAVLDANKSSNFFFIKKANITFTVRGITFINSNGYDGYSIANDYDTDFNCSFIDCNFENNTESLIGLYCENRTVEFINCNFTSNDAGEYTLIQTDNATFENCNFKKNIGSILYAKSFNNCRFTQNECDGYGFIFDTESFTNCEVTSNKNCKWSFINTVKLVSNCIFTDNVIYGNGAVSDAGTVMNSKFERNEARRAGDSEEGDGGFAAAIFVVDTVKNCTFKSNKASTYGGAISLAKTVSDSVFENNEAWEGGAIDSVEEVINCNFTQNKAINGGGAIDGVNTVKNSNFNSNHANGGERIAMSGGGAICTSESLTVDGCSFVSNTADTSGSAIMMDTIFEKLELTISNSKFLKNTAKGDFVTGGYDYKHYANGVIYVLGLDSVKLSVRSSSGLDVENTDKFKLQTKIILKAKNNVLTIKVEDAKSYNALEYFDVLIKINGKTIKRMTDDNGQIKYKLTGLVPKTYSITVSSLGDDERVNASQTIKVKVKKLTAKITAKKHTFKSKKKVKKVKVTMKSGKTPVKKQKLVLKIKNKKFTAKTNKKGTATFKVKFSKKGNFKAKVTYAGNKFYKKAKGTVKIKIA